MKHIKRAARLVAFNAKALLGFEIAYKAACALIFEPLLLGALYLTMRLRGYAYLTLENVFSFLASPLTILMLVLILLLAAFCATVDIGAVLFALDQSTQRSRVTVGQTLRFALRNAARVWRPKNILLVPIVLLLLPFLHLGLASGFLSTVSIPEFILDYIHANTVLTVLFALLIVLLTVLAMRWLYAFFYFTLEGRPFSEAHRKSVALGRGRRVRDFVTMLLMQAVFFAFSLVLILLAIALAGLLGKLFAGIFVLRWLTSTAVWLAIALALALAAALTVPVGYGCVSILYYRRKEEIGEEVVHTTAPVPRKARAPRKWTKYARGALICLIAAGSLTLGFLLNTGRINPRIEYLRTMQVTAHRGASALYPENTMAAFEGAQQLGADWIELDVQQSRDGQIFVMHDTNFRRTTGLNADSWTLDYADIAKLDAGSFFSADFAGERIPLLSEVLAFAQETGMHLNIELKPTGYEADFEKCVVDEIRAADMADKCVITSQVYEVLEHVKAYDPDIRTVYVMGFAYGDINRLSAADDFSVEAMNVTKTLVSHVHNAGKEIYAWTINTREGITDMIELNVDNIITDDIELARQCIYDSRYGSLLEEYVKLFLD